MITLLQLINLFKNDNDEIQALLSWCQNIQLDNNEVYELAFTLEKSGIELSQSQIDSLVRVCENGTYISAFKLRGF